MKTSQTLIWRERFALLYLLGTMGLFGSIASMLQSPRLGGMAFIPLYAGLLIFFVADALNGLRLSTERWTALLFLLLGLLLTALLSYRPLAAASNVALLFLDLFFAVWLTTWANDLDFRRLIVTALAILILLAIPVALYDRSLLIYNDPLDRASVLGLQNIKGLVPHKIHAGLYNAIGVVCAWSLYRTTTKRRYLVLAIAFLFMAAAAGSSLALVSLLLGGGLAWLLMKTIRKFGWMILGYVIAWLVFLLVLVILFDLYPAAMKALGRDPSMTGRIPIWKFGLDFIASHPLLGGGFGIFFDPDMRSPAQALWRSTSYYAAPSFHSGYIQVLAEAGVVGSFGFFLMLAFAMYKVVKSQSIWLLWLIMIGVVANTAAALFVTHRSLVFLMFAFFAFAPVSAHQPKSSE